MAKQLVILPREVVDYTLSPAIVAALLEVRRLLDAEVAHADFSYHLAVRGQTVWACNNEAGDVPPGGPAKPTEYW